MKKTRFGTVPHLLARKNPVINPSPAPVKATQPTPAPVKPMTIQPNPNAVKPAW